MTDEQIVAIQRALHRVAAVTHSIATNISTFGTALVDLVHAWEDAKAPPDDPDLEPH
jgi:hypothetical protein